MQRTADRLTITVGEGKYPLVLTDSAVEAVQGEAAGQIENVLSGLDLEVDFLGLELNDLLTLRQSIGTIASALDVLIECRPLDELDTEDDG